jgi:hypothetical protein
MVGITSLQALWWVVAAAVMTQHKLVADAATAVFRAATYRARIGLAARPKAFPSR